MLKHVFAAICVLTGLFGFASGQPSAPKTAEELFSEGLALLRSKSFEASLASFEKSAVLNPKQPATFMNIGSISLTLQRFEKAESAFRSAIKLDPTNGTFRAELCAALSMQRKHPEALAECDEAVRLDHNSERAHVARLNAMRSAGKSPEVIQNLADQLAARFRNSEIALATAADASLYNRNFSYAVSILESLVSLNPNVAMYHGLLAEAYLRVARDAESLASARTALKLDSDNPYGNYAMGLIFYELGQHEEAVESFSKVPVNDARFTDATYYRALSETKRGRTLESVKLLRELAANNPERLEFQYELARNLSTLHLYDEAERYYIKANALRPDQPDILSGLGMSHMMRGQFEKAIVLFDQALRLRPENEFYKMFLNVSRTRLNLIPQIPSVAKEVDSDPKNLKRRLDLAKMLFWTNRFDDAERYVKEIYLLDPDDPIVYQTIGVSFSESGQQDKALDAYKRSLSKKENPGAYAGIAPILASRGEFEAASKAFERLFELKGDMPNFMKMYADLLRDAGKRREALGMYKRSLALLPTNGLALFEAGILSMKLGERDAAMGYLGTLKTVNRDLSRTLERCLALRIWG